MSTVRTVLAAALIVGVTVPISVLTDSSPVAAAPELTVTKEAPGTVLAGEPVPYTLTASNPGDGPQFNLTFRDVLPLGATYAGSTDPASAGDPEIITNDVETPPGSGEFVSQQTLIWNNVADLQAGDSYTLSFDVDLNDAPDADEPNTPIYVVGSEVSNEGQAFASPNDPRRLPPFDADGVPIPDAAIDGADSLEVTTQLTAIEITKAEPSPEGELLRGVHDHPTVYTLTVEVTEQDSVSDVVVTDLLAAELEFLGCGGLDNSSGPEFPGAPSLTGTPAVTGCVFPDTVDTVVNPPAAGATTYPDGTYTRLTWNLGVLAAGSTVTLPYAAGIPLRRNAPFAGTPPTPVSGGQAANLDNNTGLSTRETTTEFGALNVARAAGTYDGLVEPGTSQDVESDDDLTREVEDVRMRKSVSPTVFAPGGRATYTVVVDVSEYVSSTGIVLSDSVPNGICPLFPGENYAVGDPIECDGDGADQPTISIDGGAPIDLTFASVVEDTTDGGFDLVFDPLPGPLPPSSTATITYYGGMRQSYVGGRPDGDPPVAGDGLTNRISLTATTTPIADTGETGPETVLDESEATQETDELTLDKQILPRTGLLDPLVGCPETGYAEPPADPSDPSASDFVYRLGDLVCFKLRVDFPDSISTRNPIVADFLPVGVEYVAGSASATANNVGVTIELTEPTLPGEVPVWRLGDVSGANRFVGIGGVFEVVLAGVVTSLPDGDSPEVRGNLMKMSTDDSLGRARSYRDQLPFAIAPAPPAVITKGVAEVTDPEFVTGSPNVDDVEVVEGATVTYRVDITNDSDPDIGYSIRELDVWDVLPPGITCARVSNITNFVDDVNGGPVYGACTDPGDGDHPTFDGAGTRSAIRWQFPLDPDDPDGGVDRWAIFEGDTRTLNYDVEIPTPTGVDTRLVNDASVRSYTGFTNQLDIGATYFPADNVDTTVPPEDENTDAATDPSAVFTRGVEVVKAGVTSIDETNNDLLTQAVPGELITYTYSVVIPKGTSVFDGELTDDPSNRIDLLATPAPVFRYYPDASTTTTAPPPAGFSLAGDGTLTFPTIYTNESSTDERFEVEIVTRVRNDFGNQPPILNTATFTANRTPGGQPLDDVSAGYAAVARQPRPTLLKSADPTTAVGGQTVEFTLDARTNGGRPPLHDSFVVDCIPDGLTFVAFGPGSGTTFGPAPGGAGNTCPVDTTYIAFRIGTIEPGVGNRQIRTYTATVDLDAVGGDQYTNTAVLSGSSLDDGKADPFDPDNPIERTYSDDGMSTVTVPGAAIAKSVDPEQATIGEEVTYTVVVTVPDNTNFFQAAVREVLPAGLDPATLQLVGTACVEQSAPIGICTLDGTLLPPVDNGSGVFVAAYYFGDVPASPFDRTVAITYTARLADVPGSVAGGTVTNLVQSVWDATDGPDKTSPLDTWTNSGPPATADVTVLEPDVSLAKAVSDPNPEPDETFLYTLTFTNATGPFVGAAFNAAVVDLVPVGVVVDTTSISNGGSYDAGTREITWEATDLAGPLAPGASIDLTYEARLAPSATLDGTTLTNTAELASYEGLDSAEPDDNRRVYSGNEDTADVTPAFPDLTTVKTASDGAPAYIDDPYSWTVTVTNDGDATAFGVAIDDDLPPNWTYVAGSAEIEFPDTTTEQRDPVVVPITGTLRWLALGELAPGETITLTFEATPDSGVITDPGIGSGVAHTNSATSTGFDASGAPGNANGGYGSGDTANTRIDAVDLELVKEHIDPPVAGETFDWTVTVTNLSTTDTAVGEFTVVDALPTTAGVSYVSATGAGWTCAEAAGTVTCERAGSLLPLVSLPAITIRVALDADLADGTVITNTASVDGRTYDTDPINNSDTDPATVTTEADLAIVKGLTTPLVAGEEATYRVEVDNLGPSVSRATVADPITVVDTLPAGAAFVSVDGGPSWNCSHDGSALGGDVTCNRTIDLPPGPAPDIDIVVELASSASGSFVNTASVTPGTTTDPVSSNDDATDTTTVDGQADLSIEKVWEGSDIAGATTDYLLTVSNAGPSDAAATVSIVDTLPTGLTYSGAASVDGTWTCAATTDGFDCDLDGPLALGDSASVRITVDVASDVLGEVVNTASTSSSTTPDPVPGNNTTTEPATFVGEADVSITKTSSGTTVPGGTVAWTITVANAGPSDAQGPITVTDVVPAGLIAPIDATGTGWSCGVAAGIVTCDRAVPLAAGASAPVITLSGVADPSGSGAAPISNSATVASATLDPDTSNNTDGDVVTIEEPAVTLAKSVDDATPQPGDVFTYSIELTNAAGPTVADAYAIEVSDVVPVGVDVVTPSISNGGLYDALARTITWTVAGPIAAGDTATLTYDAELGASATIDGSTLTNTATLDEYASLPSGGRTYTGNSDDATVTPRFPSLTASKSAPAGQLTYIDDEFPWSITITNVGDGTADTVTVVDTLPPNWTYVPGSTVVTEPSGVTTPDPSVSTPTLTWADLGPLAPGQSLTVAFRAVPGPGVVTDPGVGSAVDHVNTARADATDPSGASGNADGSYASGDATAVARIDAADLVVDKSSTGTPVAGEQFSFTIDVSNDVSADPAVGPFTLVDTLPAGTTFVAASGTDWSCSHDGAATGGVVTCARTDGTEVVAPGGVLPTVTVTVFIPADLVGDITNTATVDGRTYELDPATNTDDDTVTVVGEADLRIVKDRTATVVTAGEPITYTLAVTNLGPSFSRATITVTDSLSPLTAFVSATGTGWSCGHDGAATGGMVTCDLAGDLGVGAAAEQIVITADIVSGATTEIVNTATVDGPTTDPNPDNDTDDDRVTPTTSADLRIEKRATGPLVAGENATYRLRVDNAGPSDAASPVQITDVLTPELTFAGFSSVTGTWFCSAVGGTDVTCDLTGPLAAGDFAVVDLVVAVDSGVTDPITNTATVSSPTPDPDPGNNSDDDGSSFDTLADLSIIKSSSGAGVAGEPLVWTLTVENGGPSDSQPDITVTDTLPAAVSFVSATGTDWSCVHDGAATGGLVTCTRATVLPAGATAPAITLTVDVLSDAGPATIVNRATVDGPTNDPDPGNNADDDRVTLTDEVDVSITKVAAPNPVTAGEQVIYTLTVENAGPSDADDLVVIDSLPGGLTVASVDGTGWTCSVPTSVTILCERPVLFDGASTTITVVADVGTGVPTGTELDNLAVVDTSSPDTDPDNNRDVERVTVETDADLAVTKAHPAGPVLAGDPLRFSIAVTNNGPSDAVGPITVVDDLPAGMTYLAAQSPWSCVAAGSTITCRLASGVIAGDDAPELLLDVQTDPTLDEGVLTNTATVSSPTPDSIPDNDVATDDVQIVTSADVSITKTHDPGAVRIGEELTFTLLVSNAGPSEARDVVVTDTLPAGLSLVDASGDGWSCGGAVPTVTCSLDAPLAPGTSAAPISVVAEVEPSAFPGVSNTATVGSSTDDPDAGNNASTDDVDVPALVDLTIDKVHGGDVVVDGEISYELTVGNSGPIDESADVTVIDVLPDGLDPISATSAGSDCEIAGQTVTCVRAGGLAVGETFTIEIVATVLASAYPAVTNIATVSSPTDDVDPSNNTADDTAEVPAAVDLSITKTVATDDVIVGSTIEYLLVVANAGPTPDPGRITVTDTLPGSLTPTSASSDAAGVDCEIAGQTVTCTAPGPLGVGESFDIVITADVGPDAAPDVANTARVSTPSTDRDPSNDSDTVTTPVEVSVALTIDKSLASLVGRSATWRIVVGNAGPSATVDDVVMTDALPDQLTFVSATGSGWVCSGTRTITCTFAGVIAAGAQAPPITIVTTLTGSAGTTVTNTAEASGGGPNVPVVDGSAVVTVPPDIPVTGSDAMAPIRLAVVLVLAGFALVLGSTRRRLVPVMHRQPGG